MSSKLASNMRATSEAFVMSFDGKWESDSTLAQRAPECKQTMLPSSFAHGEMSNDDFAARLRIIGPLIHESKVPHHAMHCAKIDDYLGVPEERRAVIRASISATTAVGPFQNEYVFFFDFDESGEKITKIVEFVDSTASVDIQRRFKEAGHM